MDLNERIIKQITQHIEDTIANKKIELEHQREIVDDAVEKQNPDKAYYFQGRAAGTEYEINDLESILNTIKLMKEDKLI